MGYAQYEIDGKLCGYAVPDICNLDGCTNKIDRGLAYACGGYPGAGNGFCDGYFCGEHLILGIGDKEIRQLCPNCFEEWEKVTVVS